MGKKGKSSLKSTLFSQQDRLKHKKKVAEVSQSVEQKKKGKQKAKSAVNSKGKGVAKPRRPTIPLGCSDRILLIGEGNFSFACALFNQPPKELEYLPASNVTATAYDSEEDCYAKYTDARENVAFLKDKGVELLFDVDATRLEKIGAFKGRTWDKIVWNFPHAGESLFTEYPPSSTAHLNPEGKGITDQDRNILSNQRLILDFLRSASHFLCRGPAPVALAPKSKKKSEDDEDDEKEDEEGGSELEDQQADAVKSRGTVLITLRNQSPYTLWDIPRLAKNPPPPTASSVKPTPPYVLLRSFAFHRNAWHGYEHRMTKGERAHGAGTTGQGGEDRTWEFYLRDVDEPS